MYQKKLLQFGMTLCMVLLLAVTVLPPIQAFAAVGSLDSWVNILKDMNPNSLTYTTNAIIRVQVDEANTGSSAVTSFTGDIGNNPVNGNTLIAAISTRGNSADRVSSITQTNVTWSRVTQATNANGITTEIWYAPGVANADDAYTINLVAALRAAAVVAEYRGLLIPTSYDVSSNNTGNGTAASTGTTVTTNQAAELWFGAIGFIDSARSLGSYTNSFTEVGSTNSTSSTSSNNAEIYALERFVSATGGATTGGTISSSTQWAGAIATFKGAVTTPYSFTISAGSNRLTLAGVCVETNNTSFFSSIDVRLDSPTGAQFSQIARTTANQSESCYMGYLKEADLSTGTHKIYLSIDMDGGDLITGVHVDVGTYQGVDQANPIHDSAANNAANNTVTFGSQVDFPANSRTVYIASHGDTATGLTHVATFSEIVGARAWATDHSTSIAEVTNVSSGSYLSTSQVSWTGGAARSAIVVASLNPFNQTPTDINLSNSSLAENLPSNTVVGTFSTIDPDAGDTFTYALSGADAASFNVLGSDLRSSASFNYEVKNSYSITVRSTDQNGLFYEKAFVITVSNVDEPPVITSNGGGATAAISVPENSTAVTDVNADDPELATLTFTKSGDDEEFFSLDSSSGVLAFITAPVWATPADLNGDNIYEVTVQVSDGALTDNQAISVTVTKLNAPPVITEGDSTPVLIDEDNTPTAFSLTLHATDTDSPTLTWSISVPALHGTAGASGNGLSKVITYVPTPNYNGTDSFIVQVTDGSLWDSIVVNVSITPIADIYYVDNTQLDASDGNPGTDPTLPLATISRGAVVARAGDTVHVLAGTYPETVWIDVYSGVSGFPITFEADPGVTVSGNGTAGTGAAFTLSLRSYIVIDGFNITGTAYKGIFAVNSDHITISNNVITDAGQHVYLEHQQGIHFKTVVNSTIDGNLTYDNSCIGIRLTHASNNNMVSNNISYGNYSAVAPGEPTDAAGIELDDSDNNLVIHNIVYSNEDSGINLYISPSGDGSNNNLVIGNLSYGNGDHGIDNNSSSGQIIIGNTVHGNYTSGINLELNSGGATIANNILSNNGLAPAGGRKPGNIYVDDTSYSGTNLDYNLYYLSGGTIQIKWNTTGYATLAAFQAALTTQEDHGLEGNPLFVAPAPVSNGSLIVTVGDYHLMALSPAIDSANADAPNEPTSDLDGNPRVDDPTVANTGAGTRAYDDRGVYERQIPLATTLTVQPITDTYGNTVTLSATLIRTSNSQTLNNKLISFTLNGAAACSDTTDSSGIATCTATLLANVNTYPTGVGASFAGDGQYDASSDTDVLTVNPKALTVTGVTANNKIYDGTTTAVLNIGSASLVGIVGADDVTLVTGSAVGTFNNKNVGDGKTVTVSGLTLGGTKAGNYTLTQPTTTANITVRDLTVTASGVNKVYDGTATATVTLLDNRIAGDVLTTSYTGASFADENVGVGKAVSVAGIAAIGADAGNYNLLNTTAATTADISAKHIIGSFTADNKVYDGTTAAVVLTRSLTGVIAPDVVSLDGGTAAFANENVGSAKVVTLTGAVLVGADLGNYILDSVAAATANITAKHITGSFTADNKLYDGTTAAAVLTRSLTGVIAPDVVSLAGGTAAFADENVGTAKVVTLTGAVLAGADLGNYILDSVATTTANITAKHITGAFTADNKVYDGTTAAVVLTRSLVGAIGGDDVSLDGGTAAFANENVGTAKVVTLTGAVLAGADLGNYILDSVATITANITAKHITGSFTVDNKMYDGSTVATVLTRSLTGVIAPDVVSLDGGTAAFANENVGVGKVVSLTGAVLIGADLANYLLDSVATATADITVRDLTVTASGVNKVYDGTTAATVTLLDNRIAGDVLTTSYTGASFADENVGVGKAVSVTGITVIGADAGNYNLLNTTAATTADISAKHITGSFTADNKVYDGTTAAVVLTRSLIGVIAPDVVSLDAGTGTFADKNVGVGKVVTLTGAVLSGADAGNYILDSVATATADITVRDLAVTAIGVNKVYDATTAATVTFTDDRIAGDVLTINYTASFAGANVATAISVSVTGISIGGTDAANYNLLNNTSSTTADITPKPVTVTPTSGLSKIYGELDPVFTYTYGPDTPPATFTGALSRLAGEKPGTYPITMGDLSAGSNFTVTLAPTTFRIIGFSFYLPLINK